MQKTKIGNKLIGDEEPCFIIAEAGVNHNGDIKLAKRLINAAAEAGTNAVKFQTFKAEGVVIDEVMIAEYAKNNMGRNLKQLEMIKSFELKYKDFEMLKEYCDKKDIIFLSTPHSFDAIDFLEELVPAYKFGSGDLTNIPALQHAARKKKPMILGTGMATMNEVKEAIHTIRLEGNDKIIALHCTTNYPCPVGEVNLKALQTMKNELDCLVGYSDHTIGISVPIAAVALGACVIEKHFTIDKNLPGPDHRASIEPNELKEMVIAIRDTEKALGSPEKIPVESEKKIMRLVRKSIVANVDIPKGTIITRDMLAIKRPGTGIEPQKMSEIIGRKARKIIKKNALITMDKIEG